MEESDSRWTGAAIAGEGSDRKWRGAITARTDSSVPRQGHHDDGSLGPSECAATRPRLLDKTRSTDS